jgi:predicted aspartyl protease
MTLSKSAEFLSIAIALVANVSAICHAQQSETGTDSQPVTVQFDLAHPDKPLILLDIHINGEGPFRFVLDTGAGRTMISPQLAEKLGIGAEAGAVPGKATGASGSIDVHATTLQSIRAGDATLDELPAGIMDLEIISKAIETEIDGILGYTFLRQFRVTIDYAAETVTFERQ